MILCGFKALAIFAFRVLSLCPFQNIQWWSSLLKHGLSDFYIWIFLSLSNLVFFAGYTFPWWSRRGEAPMLPMLQGCDNV
jgi:hypothetical protein